MPSDESSFFCSPTGSNNIRGIDRFGRGHKEIVGKTVEQGEAIGTAQDLTIKYPGITNHVHFEITLNGEQVDPSRFLQEEALCKH